MSDTYQAAIQRRDALRGELALIEQFLALHDKLFGDRSRSVAVATDTRSDAGNTDTAENSDRKNDPKAVAETAAKVIESAGLPMQRGKLIAAIEAAGVPIHSKDKSKYIGTVLWRNRDRFENVEGLGYWLKGKPLPFSQESMAVVLG